MAEIVYLLCSGASIVAAGLLIRSYLASRSTLLLWSSICFVGLAINNVLLFVDLVLTPPSVDLTIARSLVALGAMLVLIYGLIRDVH